MEKQSVVSNFCKIIDPDQILNSISKEDKQNLTCLICLGIAINPVECTKCETLFCQSQMMAAGELKNCPICKAVSWKKGSQIHKSYKTKLYSLEIKCDLHLSCKDEKYTYQKYVQHMKEERSEVKKVEEDIYYQFYYLADGEKWEEYTAEANTSANVYLKDSIKQFVIGGYQIDMNKMIQTNILTSFERKIKIVEIENRIEEPFWTIDIEGNSNEPYDYEGAIELEKAYQEWKEGNDSKVIIKVMRFKYEVDFEHMEQTNIITKTKRSIKRIVL